MAARSWDDLLLIVKAHYLDACAIPDKFAAKRRTRNWRHDPADKALLRLISESQQALADTVEVIERCARLAIELTPAPTDQSGESIKPAE